MLFRLSVSLIVLLMSLPAFSQEPIPESFLEDLARDLATLQQPPAGAPSPFIVRMVKNATVYAGAATDTREVGRLGIGEEAPVIDNAGSWYAIQLPNQASGWVQAQDVAPPAIKPGGVELENWLEYERLETEKSRWFQKQILSLLERAAQFRDNYRDNPYLAVRGFDISLSLTGPTLGMSFEFKE